MQKKPKPITVAEAGRRGGRARAKKYPPEQLRKWAKLGGRPRKTKPGVKGKGNKKGE